MGVGIFRGHIRGWTLGGIFLHTRGILFQVFKNGSFVYGQNMYTKRLAVDYRLHKCVGKNISSASGERSIFCA